MNYNNLYIKIVDKEPEIKKKKDTLTSFNFVKPYITYKELNNSEKENLTHKELPKESLGKNKIDVFRNYAKDNECMIKTSLFFKQKLQNIQPCISYGINEEKPLL